MAELSGHSRRIVNSQLRQKTIEPHVRWGRKIALGFAYLLLAGVAYVIVFAKVSPSQTYAEKRCADTTLAFIMSKRFVERQLRAPATASFHFGSAQQTEPCKFLVRGAVDAQNGFGALIRTGYSIRMHYNAFKDEWTGTGLSMGR